MYIRKSQAIIFYNIFLKYGLNYFNMLFMFYIFYLLTVFVRKSIFNK